MGRVSSLTFRAALATAAAIGPARAADVTIIALDGSRTTIGELQSTEGGEYVLETRSGIQTFRHDLHFCKGRACPPDQSMPTDFGITAPPSLVGVLLPLMLEGYVASSDGMAFFLDDLGRPLPSSNEGIILDLDRPNDASPNFEARLHSYEGEDIADVAIHPPASGSIFEDLAQEHAHFAVSASVATDSEVDLVRRAGGGDLRDPGQARVIALDGYALISNPENRIASITAPEAAAVLAGRISNWSTLGGPNLPIVVYSLPVDSDEFGNVEKLLLGPEGRTLRADAQIVESPRALAAAVAADPAGFGVTSFSRMRDNHAIPLEGSCGMVVPPTPFTIKTEEYGLQTRVLAYNRADIAPEARGLLDFITSTAVDGVVAKSGMVNLSIIPEAPENRIIRIRAALEPADTPVSGDDLRQMVGDMLESTRLSTTFRFSAGSTQLDNKALRDLARVAGHIAENKPRRVVLAGFADAAGSFEQNTRLSLLRAESVLEQLRATAGRTAISGVEIVARGFGELGPVACNDNPEGRATNRRVEVWIEY